jgi:hypothetical protein
MANLVLNKIYFKLLTPIIPIYVSAKIFPNAKKKTADFFADFAPADLVEGNAELFYSFAAHEDAQACSLNLLNNRYFFKPYVTRELRSYFEELGLMTLNDFVNGLQLWRTAGAKNNCTVYDKISLRQVTLDNISRLEMLISYDGQSLVSQQPLAALNTAAGYAKYIAGGAIHKLDKQNLPVAQDVYPVLGYELRRALNMPGEHDPTRNTYKEYYEKISEFYTSYLQGKQVGDNLQFFDFGFKRLKEQEIWKTKFVSNKLRFGNDGEDNSIHSGLKRYGPYAAPDSENLRFIFVYKPAHAAAAKKLHSTLTQGLQDGAFAPGLKDYVKVNYKMGDPHRIVLDSNDPVNELEAKIADYPFSADLRYFVIYLTDHNRFESEDENEEEYYKVKYLLLNRGILSQFIWHKNILANNFRFHLPNIQVAILAKLGGIPWKLDTFSDDKLIIGFGVKKINNEEFLGNSLFFKEDGTFHKFESFQRGNIQTIGDALKHNIETVLQQDDLKISKLVIHYYKTLNDEEGRAIEKTLKFFNLDIPFVVLTINDSKSKDYVFFDTQYSNIMPVSGTIIELKWKSEYLLSNNMRHDELQSYRIWQYPFPLKIKVNKPENVLHDIFDVKQLIDQVYSFSRIYWKSIGQASLPVTISYSKIVADLAAHFPGHELPQNPVAHTNLWFL